MKRIYLDLDTSGLNRKGMMEFMLSIFQRLSYLSTFKISSQWYHSEEDTEKESDSMTDSQTIVFDIDDDLEEEEVYSLFENDFFVPKFLFQEDGFEDDEDEDLEDKDGKWLKDEKLEV